MASLENTQSAASIKKITTSAHAHVWNDAFWSSTILKDVLIYRGPLFSLVTPIYLLSMGPVDPSEENRGKDAAF